MLAGSAGLEGQRARKLFCARNVSHDNRTSTTAKSSKHQSASEDEAESWLVPNGWETGSVSCRSGLANRIRARSVANVLAQTYNFAGLLASGLTMNQLTGATSSRSFGKNLASLTAPSSTTTSWEISTSPQRPGRTNCYPKSMETDREQHRETWKRQQVEGALQKE